MKYIISIFIFILSSLSAFSQKTGWECNYQDWSDSREYFCLHRTQGVSDAFFYVKNDKLTVYKYYNGKKNFDLAVNNGVLVNDKISSETVRVKYVLVGLFDDDFEYEMVKLNYYGDDDQCIYGPGFSSAFSMQIDPELLKDAKAITFEYFDKITQKDTKITLSLMGFTKAYNKAIRYSY